VQRAPCFSRTRRADRRAPYTYMIVILGGEDADSTISAKPLSFFGGRSPMTDIQPGDLVIAVPIADCSIGHPDWHLDFGNPEMNRKSYIVTWCGFSEYWKRPIIDVAGRPEHFCAGCFVRQMAAPVSVERTARAREPAACSHG